MYIYGLTESKNNIKHIYIGFTKGSLENRLRQHIGESKRGRGKNRYVYNWMRKLEKDPEIFLIQKTSIEKWSEDEKSQIETWRKKKNIKVLNLTDGGEGKPGHVCSEETKKKMSKVRVGMKFSEEHRGKISIARNNMSAETKRKMSESHKKIGSPWNKGRKMTPEQKGVLSKRLTGRKMPPDSVEKLRKRMIGNKYTLGRKLSKEHRNKISESNKGNTSCLGKRQSDETKIKRIFSRLNIGKKDIFEIKEMLDRNMQQKIVCKKIGVGRQIVKKIKDNAYPYNLILKQI